MTDLREQEMQNRIDVSVKSSGVGVFIANKKASQGWLTTKMTICSFAGFHRPREGWCPEALDEF